MREYYTRMSLCSSGLLNGAIVAVTIAIGLITASYLHVGSPPQWHEAMPKLAQYCLPDQHDADRVFCGLYSAISSTAIARIERSETRSKFPLFPRISLHSIPATIYGRSSLSMVIGRSRTRLPVA
jgi:hypothetical protein